MQRQRPLLLSRYAGQPVGDGHAQRNDDDSFRRWILLLVPRVLYTFWSQVGHASDDPVQVLVRLLWRSLICILNAATMIGYCILNSIVGGQTLAAVSSKADGSATLTPDVGIVVATLIALVVSFSGIRVLHYFERFFWLPTLVCFASSSVKQVPAKMDFTSLRNQPKATANAILGFAAIIAGFIISTPPSYRTFRTTSNPTFRHTSCFGVSTLDSSAVAYRSSCSVLHSLVLPTTTRVGQCAQRFQRSILQPHPSWQVGPLRKFPSRHSRPLRMRQYLSNDLFDRLELPNDAPLPRTRTPIRMAPLCNRHLSTPRDRGSQQVLRNPYRLHQRPWLLGQSLRRRHLLRPRTDS